MADNSDEIIPHRDLPRRMLAAVEDRVRRVPQPTSAKGRARLQEACEILGILRNTIKAYERID